MFGADERLRYSHSHAGGSLVRSAVVNGGFGEGTDGNEAIRR